MVEVIGPSLVLLVEHLYPALAAARGPEKLVGSRFWIVFELDLTVHGRLTDYPQIAERRQKTGTKKRPGIDLGLGHNAARETQLIDDSAVRARVVPLLRISFVVIAMRVVNATSMSRNGNLGAFAA
jgi:hypothetical protein